MIIIGVGEYSASRAPGDGLKTFALGSCVAVILYDAASQVAGMAHVALPDSSINRGKSGELPGYFADTAVPALLAAVRQANEGRLPPGLHARLAGGASILRGQEQFQIGKRNVAAVRTALAKFNVRISREEVGGSVSRTVSVDVQSGSISIFSPGRAERTL
ncbi:chemotaxis protein CheD [Megalodesulfovibrio gigas]|uniref:Probable chemoreceptor glutamine deamidase CheD n=1 Tax=Megalodesulfovibrio gigas (strain ATCC 19364 / DSM 1382 / NCIMB 9332 / VKM B-1759) TaxID=1121448 RepID=T2GCR0_MEGG1|nr:chemotaxis protein CheD [Megalodesulfovibrio gigas]AGW14370.1 putative CheD-like chemotaxis protein [Megalodesulfovibrio gigas DSM 1382 = ATCC 19364]